MKFFGTTISEIDDTLDKLKKITRIMNELKLRKFKLETWIKKWDDDIFDYVPKSKERLAYIPKVQARLERMFQNTLAKLFDFDFFCRKFTGEILDYMEDHEIYEIIKRADRILIEWENKRMTPRELKADEAEFEVNAKKEE